MYSVVCQHGVGKRSVNKYDVKISNRLKRTEGQLKGILKMIADEKECKDVVTQLSAVRSSIDRVMGLIVAENLVDCVKTDMSTGVSSEESIQQAIDLLVKSR